MSPKFNPAPRAAEPSPFTVSCSKWYEIPCKIESILRWHMPELLAIEEKCFPFPWQEDDFILCLRQRICAGKVAVSNGRVLGFMIYELHKHRLHILNFAVHPEFRRFDVGTQLVDYLKPKLSADRRSRIMLEIREINLSAQLFFRSMGFRAVSVLRSFYEDTTEDGYLFQFRYKQQRLLE